LKKYVTKGVIGDLPAVALYIIGARRKMKSGISSPGHLESKNRSERQHHAHEFALRIPGAAMIPGARLKNDA